MPQRAHQPRADEGNPFIHGMRVCWQGQTGGADFGAGGTGKVTIVPKRALLLSELGFAYVGEESGVGRAALGEVGAGLGQA